ncbi:MAG: GIY-YIG nuclease family protein [Ezakiella sp.]|nr:GIY-YIG nuclease family protein [Ezakiella sp.]MDD7471949.1 GIY-YIG nuclease family protein [Bacillota bacterium]MDY3923913.1 GIY-YIG nuclease family protein [Ezakiella sp.]
MNDEKYFVYILECSDNTLYCGITNDIKKRLVAHNNKRGAKYTRGRTPVKLVYFEEACNKGAALSRERAIKKLNRESKIKLIKVFKNKEIVK